MALVVGTDSYVTVDEADEYVSNYVYESFLVDKWTGLTDNVKEILLRTSCRDIDSLRNIDGEKLNLSQKLQFPRRVSRTPGYGFRLYISQFVDNGLVTSGGAGNGLSEVKQAQVENAIWHSYLEKETAEITKRGMLGVTSKKAGSVAETYETSKQTVEARQGIYTNKVYTILSCWLCNSNGAV